MADQKNVTLTEEAQKELRILLDKYQNRLLAKVAEGKYVPGDRLIEVTANDLKRAADQRTQSGRRAATTRLLASAYLLLGILSTIIGIFGYRWVEDIAAKDPLRLALLITGTIITTASAVILSLMRLRHPLAPVDSTLPRAASGQIEPASQEQPPEQEDPPVTPAALRAGLIKRSHIGPLRLPSANLRNIQLFYRDLADSDFSGSDISAGNMQGCKLNNASFDNAVLVETSFYDADLRKATFQRANLSRANLGNARLEGVDLRNAQLDGINVTRATYDKDTKWPQGFEPQKQGAVNMDLPH